MQKKKPEIKNNKTNINISKTKPKKKTEMNERLNRLAFAKTKNSGEQQQQLTEKTGEKFKSLGGGICREN